MTKRLTSEQNAAVKAIRRMIRRGAPLIALEGAAGTGKTTVIARLQHVVEDVVVSAMTNKAADILRSKGIFEAVTTHKAGLKSEFDLVGKPLIAYLGSASVDPSDEHADILFENWHEDELFEAWTAAREDGLAAGFTQLGIDNFFEKHFVKWGPRREQTGVLIVDEASMLGARCFLCCKRAFRKLFLLSINFSYRLSMTVRCSSKSKIQRCTLLKCNG